MVHRLADIAEAELDEIWSRIAAESGDVARAQNAIASITARFHLIASQPRMGRARDDIAPGLRSHPVEAYVVFMRSRAGT